MKILIKEHPKVNLNPIKMNCDFKLHNKLDDTELTKSFFNKTNFTLIVGSCGSGKSTWTISFIKQLYKKVFNNLYLIMPPSSRASIQDNPFEDLAEDKIHDDLDEETINFIYEMLKVNSEEDETSLLILDDVQRALKNKFVLKSLKNIIANRRHLKTTTFCIVQNYNALDKSLRALASNIICFGNLTPSQFETIREEHLNIDKETFKKIRKICYNEPHDWMLINSESERIFKKFDEIIYEESEN
jgi:type IV secretory pathway VirB4 component